MKYTFLALSLATTLNVSALAQDQKNYQDALATGLGVLTTSQGYVDLNKKFMAQQKIGENQIERHITQQAATFYDLTASKFFATEVLKSNEKINRINQARRGKDNHYDYETLVVGDDGSVSSYTLCNVDPAKATESNCHSVNAAVCGELARNNLNETQLSKDLENCTNLEKKLEDLRKVVGGPDIQKVTDDNINAMNQSQVRKYIFGEASNVAKKKIDDVPAAKQNNLQIIGDIAEMNKSCNRMKSGGFITISTTAPQNRPANGRPAEGTTPPAQRAN